MDALTDTFRAFAEALEPGGVVVIEPWIGPDDVEDGALYIYTHDEYVTALEDAGFEVEQDSHGLTGRGVYIGVRRGAE